MRCYLDALTCPNAFGRRVNRPRALAQLQRAPDEALPDCDDPVWLERRALTLAEGVRDKPDYEIYERAIHAYHAAGEGDRAVRLRVLVGESMFWETTSFQDGHGWSDTRHVEALRADIERARLRARLPALPQA